MRRWGPGVAGFLASISDSPSYAGPEEARASKHCGDAWASGCSPSCGHRRKSGDSSGAGPGKMTARPRPTRWRGARGCTAFVRPELHRYPRTPGETRGPKDRPFDGQLPRCPLLCRGCGARGVGVARRSCRMKIKLVLHRNNAERGRRRRHGGFRDSRGRGRGAIGPGVPARGDVGGGGATAGVGGRTRRCSTYRCCWQRHQSDPRL